MTTTIYSRATDTTTPAPRRPIERSAVTTRPALRMTWRAVIDEHGERVLRASWHAGH
ncbi:hypothetical protein [Amycolatopsis samaneae]|uniref:Uncharacterized protein n=1 Tax=Amycolatopsis samaneae TaxID=664691 RepID=A0ABW5GSL3_9PSEU